MKWNVCVGIKLSLDYDDIEADTREEAEEIAKWQALEDIDFNNAVEDDDVIVYCCYPSSEDTEEEK